MTTARIAGILLALVFAIAVIVLGGWAIAVTRRQGTPVREHEGLDHQTADLSPAEQELVAFVATRAGWGIRWERLVRRERPVAMLERHPPVRAEVSVERDLPPYALWVRLAGSIAYTGSTYGSFTGYGPVRHTTMEEAVADAERWWNENCAYRKCTDPSHRDNRREA